MGTIRIEILARRHRKLIRSFRNQAPSLVEYLRRYALRHAERDLLGRTYLAIDRVGGSDILAGYFSLTTASVERESLGASPTLSKLPGFPIPGVLLTRLAVDERAQGQGLGTFLFEEALGLTLQLAQSGPVVFRLLVTDALDETAAGFYRRFGLEQLSATFPARMVLDLKPLLRP